MSRKPEAECHLDGLRRGMPGLTAAAGGVLAEAAAVCLERQSHSAGVVLSIRRAYKKDIPLTWDRTTAQQRRTHNDIQEATESGACGVAILLIERLARMVVIQRSRKGTYFDYWIGRASPGSTLFQDSVRLEVSGILTGDEKTRCSSRAEAGASQKGQEEAS